MYTYGYDIWMKAKFNASELSHIGGPFGQDYLRAGDAQSQVCCICGVRQHDARTLGPSRPSRCRSLEPSPYTPGRPYDMINSIFLRMLHFMGYLQTVPDKMRSSSGSVKARVRLSPLIVHIESHIHFVPAANGAP